MPAIVCRISGLSYEILIKSNRRISSREYCSKSRVLISLQPTHATDLICSDTDAADWVEACAEEVASLVENGVYEEVERPAGKPVITSKWVFKKKRGLSGRVENVRQGWWQGGSCRRRGWIT